MATFDLAGIVRRVRNPRRSSITIRDISPPAMLATDLFASYRPVLSLLNRYAERLNAEYERTLSSMQTDSADDLNSILASLSDELQRLVLTLTPSLREWCLRVESWQRGRWRGAVLSATAVDLATLLGPADVAVPLETALAWNVDLVRDVGTQARQKMATAVFAGLQARSPARDVAKQISEATGFARDRSRRIASDQLSKLTSSLAEERQRQAGITQVEWKSSHKLHARPHHATRDGKVYDLDTRKPIDGGEAVPAGDWAGRPPYCGCRTLSRLVFD